MIGSEEIKTALSSKAFTSIRQKFKTLESVDIAEGMEDLTLEECALAFRLIPKVKRAEVFSHLPFEKQIELLEVFSDEAVTVILNDMDPVDRTGLLEALPEELSSKLIVRLDPKERKMASTLLSYPEDSVGRLMTPEFIAIKAGMTVSDAIEYIRWNASRYPEEMINRIFVIEGDGKYLGDINLGALFVADPTTQPVENLISSSYVALSAFDDEGVAVDYFRKYDRNIFPVVDDKNVLVGVVLSDDVFDVAEEEATEDLQQFGGLATLEDSYFQTPLLTLLRKRAGWLSLLFIGGLWSGYALRNFGNVINAYSYLVFFLPLIISSGGNSGSQAASLIIRGIATKDIELADWYKVLLRELRTGLGLGLILGTMGYFCALFWQLEPYVGVVVTLSLVGVVTLGSVVGSMLPFLMKALKLDPAVSSSPLIASLVDILGIMIFFNIAITVLKNYAR